MIEIFDPRSRKTYSCRREEPLDTAVAVVSGCYLVVVLVFLLWMLIDIWTGRWFLLKLVFPQSAYRMDTRLFRLIAYTVIGGGLGGVVNGIRSLKFWHCEHRVYSWRWVLKYITDPLLGIVLAMAVYAILGGGIATLGGGFDLNKAGTVQALGALAVGILTGYGARTVFKWLDEQVRKMFVVSSNAEAKEPKTREEIQPGSHRK